MWLVNHPLCGTRFFSQKRHLLRAAGYKVGEGSRVVGPLLCQGSLEIGSNCWIGKNLLVNGNGSVVIGDNCDIAPEVSFLTGGHAIGGSDRRAGEGRSYHISVGNGTWIGARSTILGDIRIEPSCVVAACACVVNDVPKDTLVGGVPAKPIRKL